eukprot:gene9165-6445_t
MSSRKRERPAQSGAGAVSTPTEKASRAQPKDAPFSIVIWNEVSTVLCARFMEIVRSTLLEVVRSWRLEDKAVHLQSIRQLRHPLRVAWEAGKRFLSVAEVSKYASLVQDGIQTLVDHLERLTAAADDAVVLCKHYLRALEEYGFVEEDGGELGACLGDLKFGMYSNGYAYSERPPAAQELEQRLVEGESSSVPPRVGYTISLTSTQRLSPLLNTSIQLIEPRKRRPPLDEYRIFSHPKKTATHGVEDVIVDEELLHRAVQVLAHHLDCYGSLQGLSPFSRFTLYNVLDKNEAAFNTLCGSCTTSEVAHKQIQKLRETVEKKREALERTRCSLREGAQRVGWFAISAQWRDQALHSLQDAEETDWYCLTDTLKASSSFKFPNYAHHGAVKALLLGVLEKLSAFHSATSTFAGAAVPATEGCCVLHVVRDVLLPMLEGRDTAWPSKTFFSAAEQSRWAGADTKVRSLFAKWEETYRSLPAVHAEGERAGAAAGTPTILLPTMLFPIQCTAEMLETCSAALESVHGTADFARSFLSAPWETEEDILAYLVRDEPTNIALAPLVALPKLFKDLAAGVGVLLSDSVVPVAISIKHLHKEMIKYAAWKILTIALEDEDRVDDLLFLTTQDTASLASPQSESLRWFTEGAIERASPVWPHEMAALVREERRVRERENSGGPVYRMALPVTLPAKLMLVDFLLT